MIRGSRCDCGGTFVGKVDDLGSWTTCDGCGFGMREYPPPAKRKVPKVPHVSASGDAVERAEFAIRGGRCGCARCVIAPRPADLESQAFFAQFAAGGDV